MVDTLELEQDASHQGGGEENANVNQSTEAPALLRTTVSVERHVSKGMQLQECVHITVGARVDNVYDC